MQKSFILIFVILLLSFHCFSQRYNPYPLNFKPTTCDKNAELSVLIECLGQALVDDKNSLLAYKRYNLPPSAGRTFYSPSNDALSRLLKIEDVRIVPYLVQNIRHYLSQNAYSEALKPLVKFDTGEALQTLEESLSSSNLYIRRQTAQIIYESKNSKAWIILSNFYKDKDSSTRGRAADILRRIHTDEATIRLREMLDDEEEWIKKIAQEELEERDKALRKLSEIEKINP